MANSGRARRNSVCENMGGCVEFSTRMWTHYVPMQGWSPTCCSRAVAVAKKTTKIIMMVIVVAVRTTAGGRGTSSIIPCIKPSGHEPTLLAFIAALTAKSTQTPSTR